VTVGEVFTITVPLTVVLMSVLGGTGTGPGRRSARSRSPALLYAFTAADHAVAGKAASGAILIAAILFMPDGILPRLQRLFRRGGAAAVAASTAAPTADAFAVPAPAPAVVAAGNAPAVVPVAVGEALLRVRGLHKAFRGVRALAGVDIEVRAARSSACSGRTARASRPSSTSSAATTRPRRGRSPSRAGSWSAGRRTASPAPASPAPTRSRGPSAT
jgi:hypothetical protein